MLEKLQQPCVSVKKMRSIHSYISKISPIILNKYYKNPDEIEMWNDSI